MLGRKLEEVSSFLSKELGKTKQIGTVYNKTCLKGALKNRQNKDPNDK